VTSATERIAASFRDPNGFVFRRGSILYRQVNEVHRSHFDRFVEVGLYDRLVADELLVAHEDADVSLAAAADAYRVILPEQIPFVSYPYEWSFSMLRDAALATLRIQELALDYGMSLRDATAYNLTFHRGRPLFLDTTSFEIVPEGRPWVAYRQFCQHFLAPLVLMSLRDARLGQLSRLYIDGVPLDLASALLPARARAKPGVALHVRMHARSQRRHATDTAAGSGDTRSFSINAFRGVIGSLRKTIERLDHPVGASVWRDYYDEAEHYSEEASGRKEALVRAWVDEVRPRTVWDLGANTGRFARLASSAGIDTLALDADPFCVDEAYRAARAAGDGHLLPLIQDLTNPSTGIGWAGTERVSLGDRGPADLIFALALIHHLAFANNLALTSILDELHRLGRWAIVEFVPKNDPKVRRLMQHREDVFAEYTVEHFEAAADAHFRIRHREPVADSGRTMYLLGPR
jgi:predicted nicotinamide N-methyase